MKLLKIALVATIIAACLASVLTSDTLAMANVMAEQTVTTARLDR